ncbi:unnamed protein product [Miscanthus lutarioriparius]|uniref:Uncharacterized protein n=1 Tax=Miscanthus lutarioriparius TaxID=422564 RepID=A0A811SHM2_9POAL|nr:unnamed protein product [Miscanthus lutarioriparius]
MQLLRRASLGQGAPERGVAEPQLRLRQAPRRRRRVARQPGSCRNDKYHDNSYVNMGSSWVFAKSRCSWSDLVCALHDVCKIEILVTRLAKSRCLSSAYDDGDPSMTIGGNVTTKGKQHLENLADITFTAPVDKAKITTKRQPFQQTPYAAKFRIAISGYATKEKEANEAYEANDFFSALATPSASLEIQVG